MADCCPLPGWLQRPARIEIPWVLAIPAPHVKGIEADCPADALDRHPEVFAQDPGDIRRQAEVPGIGWAALKRPPQSLPGLPVR